MNIMNIRYISSQIYEIVEAVLPLQESSVALRDSSIHTYTHTHATTLPLKGITHKALRIVIVKIGSDAECESCSVS